MKFKCFGEDVEMLQYFMIFRLEKKSYHRDDSSRMNYTENAYNANQKLFLKKQLNRFYTQSNFYCFKW